MENELIQEKIYYIGNFSETVKEKGSYFKIGEMFSVGTHRGVNYTEEDIKQLASEFKAEEEIPVQLDHSESAKDTVGWIKEVNAEGKKLMGKLEILDKEIQKKIDNGLMKKLSVSFYLKQMGDKLKPFKIREVSLVAFPQVKGAKLFNEQTYEKTKPSENNIQEGKQMSDKSLEDFYAEYCKEFGTGDDFNEITENVAQREKTPSQSNFDKAMEESYQLEEKFNRRSEEERFDERMSNFEKYVEEELEKLEAKGK
ncbi:hypothetical protein ABES25_06085 [Bacillus gobiensis]|uniref:hypothetical protein n=1 Tax=Bacillus gobiensis TaxID=1441095 RepID=UPI003D21BE8D